MPLDFQSVLR